MVQFVIALSCAEAVARARFMRLEPHLIQPKHNDQDGFERYTLHRSTLRSPARTSLSLLCYRVLCCAVLCCAVACAGAGRVMS
jgi:hypothetical protein